MTTSSEIYRTAHLLIDAYGEMAPVGAAIKVDQYQQAGDEASRKIWLKVVDAVEELMDDENIPQNAVIN